MKIPYLQQPHPTCLGVIEWRSLTTSPPSFDSQKPGSKPRRAQATLADMGCTDEGVESKQISQNQPLQIGGQCQGCPPFYLYRHEAVSQFGVDQEIWTMSGQHMPPLHAVQTLGSRRAGARRLDRWVTGLQTKTQTCCCD